MLDEHNVLVKSFRNARDTMIHENRVDIRLRLISKRGGDTRMYNLPTVSEVSALIVGDFVREKEDRDIIVESRTGELQRINELHVSYLPLQYPLLFPYGDNGFYEEIPFAEGRRSTSGGRSKVSLREYAQFRLHERVGDGSVILYMKRLTQQFMVDIYTMIESYRLAFIRNSQDDLRCEMYNGFSEAVFRGETDPLNIGRRIVLPATFTGGARYMIANYQDAMAICKWAGYPDLFLTFTCNPKWPEIVRFLEERSLRPEDRPDIVDRMFKLKLDCLIKDVRYNEVFGSAIAVIYTIEFQKRGLPHAHILVFLEKKDKYPGGDDIDKIISAEIPDINEDPKYYAAVTDLMMHGPCGPVKKNSPCMSEGVCTKHFPKKFVDHTNVDSEGYPVYRRRNDGRTIMKNDIPLDNRYVVPHNRRLLLKYGAHLNVEWCNQSRSIKYLFKYVNKGHDRITAGFYKTRDGDTIPNKNDEIELYYNFRYLSPCEAVWRTFGHEIQFKYPPVERLSFHLPDQQPVIFKDSSSIDKVLEELTLHQSAFLGWFEANVEYTELGKDLTYPEFPQKFVWKKKIRKWEPRKRDFALGRLPFVPPGAGDSYYVRCLLNCQKGCKSYDDLKLVKDKQYATYREACYALGLLEDDNEYIDGIIEASEWALPHSIRGLFATLLSSDCLSRPEEVWEKCWSYMGDDIQSRQREFLRKPDLILSDAEIKNFTLLEVDKLLRNRGKRLADYDHMPVPDVERCLIYQNKFIVDELQYDKEKLKNDLIQLERDLNFQQRNVFNTIMSSVDENLGRLFFVYGYGGTGKTYIWRTISAAVRSKGGIVLNVASSGIAALLLPGGRTAHSRFKIPINVNEDSTCNIIQGSDLAALIVMSKLIIWDEAPMTHKHCFECLDRTLRDLMHCERTFGGKTVVLGGDFRQILPVITKGKRQEIVNATINSSFLWDHCVVLRLTENMGLKQINSVIHQEELREFTYFIASVGDGTFGGANDGLIDIQIPEDLLLHCYGDPISTLVKSTYPDFGNCKDDSSYLEGRAILCPTLDLVESVNDYMIEKNPRKCVPYFSFDSHSKSDGGSYILQDIHNPEFLNAIKSSGVPNHQLNLKVGTPVMLLRNIDHSLGLCNGTRMVITVLGKHVLQARLISGSNVGDIVIIPRMTLTPSDKNLPFKFQRRQFPLIVSYAMTINKNQGQSLTNVGLFFRRPVFSHGQLYVALSRVTNRAGLKILICGKDDKSQNKTTNVVFKEVFRNL